MTTRTALQCSPLVALFLLASCSPDLSLLSAQTSFAGVGAGGELEPSSGGSGGGGGVSGNAGISGTGGNTVQPVTGGAGGDMPTADGAGAGAGGEPSPAPCVATGAEQCNGTDDDCNGIVDDGCPGGISTTFENDLPALGDSTGGGAFTDDCKDSEVLAGVGVRVGAFLSQIHGVCRTLSLELSGNAAHGYEVKLAAARALTAHPAMSQDPVVNLLCPDSEALVGLRIAQQNYDFGDQQLPVITRIWLSCAKLVLVDLDGKLGVGWQGPKELAPASGSFADGTAWLVASTAPDGLVGTRLLGASGNWVDRVGFGVSRLDVVTR